MKQYILAITCALSISPVFAEIQIVDAQVRAVPPTQKITAAFMTITNTGSEDLAILSASSPVSEAVELHTHIRQGDMMEMRQIDQIELPAGQIQSLQPGGLHMMLIGLKHKIDLGQAIEINLNLSNGEIHQLSATVQEVMPMSKHAKSMNSGHHPKN